MKLGFWILAGVSWLGLLVGGMFWFRASTLDGLDPKAVQQWQLDRQRLVDGQAKGTSPVTRRINPSDLPPAYVLMRDHFPVCLAAVVGFGALVMGTMGIMLYGAIVQPGRQDWGSDD